MNMSTPRKQFRFRLYFWLMDVCLFFAVLGFIDFLLGRIWDLSMMPEGSVPYKITGFFIMIFNFIVPPFLLVAKFMRDEYSNQLWQRSVTVLVYTIAIVPFVFWIALWGYHYAGSPKTGYAILGFLDAEVNFGLAIIQVWFAFQLLFVLIFQIVRWRDAR